ncbi:MAG: LytTR family DNA-binding domain-containing protein [Oscillospiraceae bacterium]
MSLIRIAICDDYKKSIDDTKQMLTSWSEESKIEVQISCYENGDDLIAKIVSNRFDIIFLDIVMPMLNGIDTAKELRTIDKTVKIIFLTSSPEFALESYSVKAMDYCLKPVVYEQIKAVMDECSLLLMKEPKNLTLKTVGGYQKIYIRDIEYIEAQNKRVFFFLRSNKSIEVVEPLYTFENKLSAEDGYFKCHRSYLVYIPNVDYFNTTEITTKSGRTIPIARGYAKNFQEAYFAVVFHDLEKDG